MDSIINTKKSQYSTVIRPIDSDSIRLTYVRTQFFISFQIIKTKFVTMEFNSITSHFPQTTVHAAVSDPKQTHKQKQNCIALPLY